MSIDLDRLSVGRRRSRIQLSAPAEPEFDPRTLPGLEVWYDARWPGGIGLAAPSDGDVPAQWNDLSGNDRHLSIATASRRPTYRSVNKNLLAANQASIETNTTGLSNTTNCSISRVTTDAAHSVASLQISSVTSGSTKAGTATGTSGIPVTPGAEYTGVVDVKAPTITSSIAARIDWFQADGSPSAITSGNSGSGAALTTSYSQRTVTATAPADAAFASISAVWTAAAGSEIVRADKLGLWAGTATTWVMAQRSLLPSFEFNQQATQQISNNSFPAIPSNDMTLYAVCSLDNQVTAGNARICRISGGAADVFFFLSVTDEYPTFNNGASTCQLASAVAPLTPAVITGVGRTGDSQVYKDGVGSALGTTDPSGNTGTAITMGSQGGSNYYPGAIAALLVFSNAHADAERQQVERWLGDVYGIAVA